MNDKTRRGWRAMKENAEALRMMHEAMSHPVWHELEKPERWDFDMFADYLAQQLITHDLREMLDEPDILVAVDALHRAVEASKHD